MRRVLSYTQIRPFWVKIRINPLHHLYPQPRSRESKGKALLHAFTVAGIPFISMLLLAREASTVSAMTG